MTDEAHSLDSLLSSCCERLARGNQNRFEAAESERISPLLHYWFVHHGYPDSLGDADARRFRNAYYRSAGKNVELLSALSEAASVFDAHHIPLVAFKGADLASRLYPNVALRPMGDVDVYVAPNDAARAEDLLVAIGFRPWSPDMTPGLSRRIRHGRLYVGGAHDAVSIDLHWSLVGHGDDARAPERDWIERHTRRSGKSWQCLSETAHLLYLAAHMKLQHYDEEIPLLWLVDFYRLATLGNIDWDELFGDAARFGWSDAVGASAFDVRERLGVTLPPPLELVARAPVTTLHRKGARHDPERVWNELRSLPWSGRVALVRAYVFPSPSYVRYRYPRPSFLPESWSDRWPAWAWPLGYVERWYEICRKGIALGARALGPKNRARPLLARRETC